MSPTDDRIKVPVNGHRPELEVETGGSGPGGGSPTGDTPATSESTREIRITASPTQLAVGFGAITGLIVLLLGAMRRRRG